MTKGVSAIIKSIISLICLQRMNGVLGQGQADCSWTVSEFAVNGTSIYNSSIDCTGTGVAPSVAAASSSIVEHFVYYTYNGVAELLLNETDYPFEAFSTAKSMITVGFLPNSSGTSLTLKATVSDLTLPYPLNYALIVNSVENFTLKHSTFVNISFSPELFFSSQKGAFFWEDAATQVDPPSISIEDAVFSDIQTSNAVGAVSFPATITSGLGFESISISRSTFSNIHAVGAGPAVFLGYGCTHTTGLTPVSFTDCIFSSNSGGMIGSPSVNTQGGALSLGPSCSYHITNCTFKDNKAGGAGGAISLMMNAQAGVFAEMTITDSFFVNNTSGAACELSGTTCASQVCGGAIQISNSSSLVVRSSVFSDNINAGGGWGGAVCLGRILQGSDQPLGPGEAQACGSSCPNNATFIGTSFHNNAATATASYGGAIMDLASDGLVFDACTFTNNTAGSGAAIYSLWSNSLVIRGGSVFQHNDPNYQYGAVVVSDMITGLNIQGATFSDNACGNSVSAAPAGGGAVYIERQLQQNPNRPNFTVNITDALFEGNSCFNGGAVFIGFASHTVGPNVTFNKNAATTASGIGGALAIQSLTSGLQAPLYSAMTNITFFGNSAPFAGGGLWMEGIWDPHLSSMTFRNNSVSSLTTITIGENAGGGMYVGYLQPINLTLKGLSFVENSAYTGAGLEVFQTNVTLESCSFIGNRAAYAAGGFRSYQLSTFTSLVQVTVVNSDFSENWSGGYGGGLQVTKAGIVLYNSTFSDNTASTGGGAVDFEISARNNNDFILYEQPLQTPYTWTNQSVYIMASSFHGNAAGVQGGAIYMDYSSVVISGCSFSSNTAKYLGGAVQASSCINGSVNVYSSSFSGNSASGGTGGALYFSSCNATFNNTNMTGNLGGAAGAVYSNLAVADTDRVGQFLVNMDDVNANNNTAVSGLGGCISTVGVNITVSRGAWTNNKAFSGGGVAACTGGGSVILQAIKMLQNNAAFSGHGGVLYMDNAPLALLTNLDVSGCTASSLNNAAGYGGVVYSSNSRQMTVSNCSFGSNNASGSGGAVYASGTQYLYILLSNITKNGAGSSGGAVFMSSGQLLSIKGVDGSLNSANQSGGAVSVSNTQNVFLEDINTSSSTATQSGGAVSATFVTNLTIDQLTSNNCYTAGSGGAIYTSSALYTAITNSSISNNIAIGSGGAVFVSSGQQLLIKGVDGSVSSASQSGGAVSVSNTQNVILENMNTSSSTATQSGGAVSATFITNLTIDQLISNNCYTTGSGGAIYMSSALHTAITNSNLSNNIAIGSGGAVYTSNSNTLDIYAANISYNSASSQGGAICVYNLSSYLSLSHTSVEYNSAKDSGGAVYTSNSNQLYLSNLNLTRNSATGSGGAVFGSNTLLMNVSGGVNISGNTALGSGGGVYSFVGGSLLLSNNVNLTSNNAGGSGGAIYVSNLTDTLNLTGLNIVSNSASGSGGGLYVNHANQCVVSSTLLNNNTANSGSGGTLYASGVQTLQVVNSSLTNSSSSLAGGCVWANVTGCALLSNSSFSTCTSSLSSGGAGFLYLPPQQLSSNYQNFSVNRSGCPVDLLQNLYPALSDSAQALLLPTTLLSSVPASVPTSTPSGKRRLEGTSQPSEFSSYIPNSDSYILPTLLISSVNVSLASAGTSGGALCLQPSPGSTALIDQLNAGSNNAISNDGGAMVVAMSVSALNSASLGNASAPPALIYITNSNLTSNLAINGYGGALALSSGPTDTTMQVSLFNSTVASNVASRGGGISIQGSGLSLSLQNSSVMYNNTARIPKSSVPAVSTSTQTSSGGCIYAQGCLSVLVSGGSKLSSCTAQPSSSITQPSYGGAISINGCSALAVHNCSITNSSADSGGAVHASTTTLLLLKDSTISNCTATGVLPALSAINATVQSSVYGTIDSFSGLGGAAQISGQSAALLQRCAFEGNSAGSFGGALSVTTNCSAKAQALLKNASQHNMSIPTPAYLPTFLTPYLDVLSPLAARASAGCFSTTLQQCSVRNNSAQVSGGGIFSSSSTGLSLMGPGCSDLSFSLHSPIDQAIPAVMTAYHPLTNLSQLAGSSCNMLGNKCFLGQGMNVGTMPASVAFTGQATQVNSAAGSTGNASAPSIPLVRFTASGSLVIPSTSPMTEINLPLYLLDALGENVTDPWLLSGISMSVGSNVEDTNILLILGTTFATYNISTSTFVFSGLSLRAVVGETYRFFFYVDSTLSGGDVIQPLSVSVVVPDCSNGEFYVFNKTACYQCRGGTFALSSAANQPADFCLPCPVGAECSGGAVVVPTSTIWHSAAASTEMHNCLNPVACKRTFQQVTQLQNCQTAWYNYLLANTTLTPSEASEAAQYLITAYNCTLLPDALNINNHFAYLNLLCADGYGGNLCAVCVTNSLGQVTGSSGSNYLCGVCSSKLQVLGANIGFFLVNLAMIIIQVMGALGEQTVVGQLQFTDISGLLISHLQYLVVVLKLGLQWPTSVTVLTTTASSITSVANEAVKVNALSCLSNDSSPEAQATYSMAGGLIIPAALIVTPLLVWLGLWLVRRHYLYPLIEAGSKKCMFCIGLPAGEEKDGGGDDDKPEVKEAENARSVSSWRADKGADSHNSEVLLTPPEVKTGDQDSCDSKQQKSVADFLGGPDRDSAHTHSYRAGPVAESQAFEEDSAEPRDVVAEQGAAQYEDRTSSDSCKISQGRRPKTMPGFSTQPSSQVLLSTLGAGLKLPPATSRAFLLPPVVHAAQEIEVAAVAAEAAASVQRSLLIRPRSEDGGVKSSVRSVGDVSLRSLQSFGSVGRSSYNVATAGDSGSALRNAVGGDLGAAFSSGKGAGQVRGDYTDGHCISMEGGSSALTSSLEGGDQVKRKDVESIKAKGKAGWDLLRHAALQAIEEDPPVLQDGKDGNPSADLERYPAVQSRSQSAAAVRQAVRVAASAFTRAAFLRRLKLPEPIISKVVPRWFVPSDAPSTEPEEGTKEGEKSGMLKALVDKLQLLDEYMPLHQQLLAVLINACFVVYQGWASSALSVFACQLIDTGVMEPSTPSYYVQFQQAAAPHGYWLLNMNQACYEGTHLSKWTPVGAVTSIIISIGIPALTALPIYLNRNNLDSAEAQHQYGWLYMKYDYKRVPYWASVAQLELLLLVLVQVFSSSFSSVIQQAAVLQVTLLVIVLINTAVWPTVHPLLVLLSFISFAVLITTIALGILIGDGTVTVGNGTISILGTLIIVINVTFIGMLVVISYRHARSAIEKALYAAKAKTGVFFKTGINTSRLLFKSASDSLRRTMSLERRLTPAQDSSSRTLHGGGNNSSSLRSSGRWSMRSILLRSSFRSSQVAAETVLADAATTV